MAIKPIKVKITFQEDEAFARIDFGGHDSAFLRFNCSREPMPVSLYLRFISDMLNRLLPEAIAQVDDVPHEPLGRGMADLPLGVQ